MPHHRVLRFALALLFALVQLTPLSPAAAGSTQAAALPQSTIQAQAPWLDAQIANGILYLLYASPASIKRYSTASQQWLAPLALPSTPTAFRVDGSDIFVALDKTLARLKLDGSGRVNVWTGLVTISRVTVDKNLLFVCQGGMWDKLYSLNRSTGQQLNSMEDALSCDSISIAPSQHKLFSRKKYTSPSDILSLSYTDTGVISHSSTDIDYNGAYPAALKIWVLPGDSWVVEDSGTIYTTSNLSYQNTLTSAFDDLAFAGSKPVVLRGGRLYAYDDRLIERTQYTPAQQPLNIFISGDNVYALRGSAQAPLVDVIPLSSFQPPAPAAPFNTDGYPYTIDGITYDPGGMVYLMNKASRNILRWSVTEHKYLAPLPLARQPESIAYAPETGKLSIAYNNKEITQVTPALGLAETPLAALNSPPCGLAPAGAILMACHSWSNNGVVLSTINASGSEVSAFSEDKGTLSFAWNSAQSRMFILKQKNKPWDDDRLLWDSISTEGVLTTGSYYWDGTSYTGAFHISDDQTQLFAAPGKIFSLTSTDFPWSPLLIGTLPEIVKDAAWQKGTLFTIQAAGTGTQIRRWNADLSTAASQDIAGSPLYLLPTSDGLLAITNVSGKPFFTIWSDSLTPLYLPPAADFSAWGETTGTIPLKVGFINLSHVTGGGSFLWDFGDGQTSTDESPEHTYTNFGKYTVSLTATDGNGTDRIVKTNFVSAIWRGYLPVTQLNFPTITYPNACQTFPVKIDGWNYIADMTECVTKIENRGTLLQVYFTWKADLKSSDCLNKEDDSGNQNMNMTDQNGNRYYMIGAGGSVHRISCMEDGTTYTGWFNFPLAKITRPVYTFHDLDNNVHLGPLTAP